MNSNQKYAIKAVSLATCTVVFIALLSFTDIIITISDGIIDVDRANNIFMFLVIPIYCLILIVGFLLYNEKDDEE